MLKKERVTSVMCDDNSVDRARHAWHGKLLDYRNMHRHRDAQVSIDWILYTQDLEPCDQSIVSWPRLALTIPRVSELEAICLTSSSASSTVYFKLLAYEPYSHTSCFCSGGWSFKSMRGIFREFFVFLVPSFRDLHCRLIVVWGIPHL